MAVSTSNFDKIKKFQKPTCSQEPKVYSRFWNFWKISFIAWVKDNTVWSQLLFFCVLHHSVFLLVFTVFTSNMNFFDISHSTPLSFSLAGFSPGIRSYVRSYVRCFAKLTKVCTKLCMELCTEFAKHKKLDNFLPNSEFEEEGRGKGYMRPVYQCDTLSTLQSSNRYR